MEGEEVDQKKKKKTAKNNKSPYLGILRQQDARVHGLCHEEGQQQQHLGLGDHRQAGCHAALYAALARLHLLGKNVMRIENRV